MTTRRNFLRRLKLRHVLLVIVLLSSCIPLLISGSLLIPKSREVLHDAERDFLIRKAGALSREIDTQLSTLRQELAQLGGGLLLAPGPADVQQRLREPWVAGYLQSFASGRQDLLALRVLDRDGAGPVRQAGDLGQPGLAALNAAFEQARGRGVPSFQFVDLGPAREPLAALAVPASAAPGAGAPPGQASSSASPAAASLPNAAPAPPLPPLPPIIVEVLIRLDQLRDVAPGAGQETGQNAGAGEAERRGARRAAAAPAVTAFLLDQSGKLLWSNVADPARVSALARSPVVQSFAQKQLSLTMEYAFASPAGSENVVAQVSAIPEARWGVVVQKPLAATFAVIDQMILKTVLATLPLVALSILFAVLAARWVVRPIQRLTETTHAIAAGSFGGRVEMAGLSFELAALAEDFNRMSGHVESYVQQLRQAAQANRDLFIGSLRAFAAAIDAKDPYTRGHSERVAALSRTIARQLLLSEEIQHKVWIGALLHDIGKIGVEDTVLRKEGVLTPAEYEQMKMHTTIGADIMSPIEQLREMIPAIRWHHEAWNGRGYPEGLKGEQIPLFARIVAVADTFDAITTNRPYQQAYDLRFAVETITKLTGSRFDAKVVTAFLRAVQAGEVRVAASRPSRAESPAVETRAAARR